MAEEFRKQKEAWRKKESELHCVVSIRRFPIPFYVLALIDYIYQIKCTTKQTPIKTRCLFQIKELQTQVEETETDRKRLERELNVLKAKEQNGRKVSEHLEEVISEENSGISYNNNNNTTPVEKQENQIQGSYKNLIGV